MFTKRSRQWNDWTPPSSPYSGTSSNLVHSLRIRRMGPVRIFFRLSQFFDKRFCLSIRIYRVFFFSTPPLSRLSSPSAATFPLQLSEHKLSDFLFFLSISRMLPGSICNPIIFISIIFSCRFLFPFAFACLFICFALDLFATLTLPLIMPYIIYTQH